MISGSGLGLGCEVYCIVTPKVDHVMYHSLYDFKLAVTSTCILLDAPSKHTHKHIHKHIHKPNLTDEEQSNKVLFDSKTTSAYHSLPLLITLYTLWNMSNKSNPQ